MITLARIQRAIEDRNRPALRLIFRQSQDAEIEGCDDAKKATLRLSLIEAAVFDHPSFYANASACVDAIRRGYHPRQDAKARSVLLSNAAVAAAQLASREGQQ